MLDFMQRRGRVLRKMGAFGKAAEALDGARQLDKADRYMNSKVGLPCYIIERNFVKLLVMKAKDCPLRELFWQKHSQKGGDIDPADFCRRF